MLAVVSFSTFQANSLFELREVQKWLNWPEIEMVPLGTVLGLFVSTRFLDCSLECFPLFFSTHLLECLRIFPPVLHYRRTVA